MVTHNSKNDLPLVIFFYFSLKVLSNMPLQRLDPFLWPLMPPILVSISIIKVFMTTLIAMNITLIMLFWLLVMESIGKENTIVFFSNQQVALLLIF